ncbi:MAG TPA: ABC transporter permease [Actinomycetes bacterium]|nr:ABC transporter permease [Actinomycetes bacterium]
MSADATTPELAPSPRHFARRRRKDAFIRYWAIFRHSRQAMAGLVILVVISAVALVAPLIVNPEDLDPATAPGLPVEPPSSQWWLGTDNFGRPVLQLLLVGSRVSLIVGIAASIGAVFIGATIGMAAGYYGGTKIDKVLNALIDWFLVIPWLVLAIALAAILGPSLVVIIAVIAVTSWPLTARLVRAQTLSVRKRPYVERGRVLGASDLTIIRRHVLPNVFPVIFANTVLTVAIAILSETTLSILGLGDPNSISWGRIIEEAFSGGALVNGYWWWILPPGVCIVVVTLAFTMCGYALDEVFNPNLRKR